MRSTYVHSAFFAVSRSPGAVDVFASMSAAHNAAATVLVKEKTNETNGTISNNVAATPKLHVFSRILEDIGK